MAIAGLSIDLEARLAGLQQSMDRAVQISEGSARQIGAAFGAATRLVGLFGVALAPAALVGWTRTVVNGIDALNDMADATGASIENLSALEDIAIRTGTSVDDAGDALIKLNKALADARPGSAAAEAFSALGLSVDDLRAQDPVQALQAVASALDNFADDGNKARLVQELFGRSLKQIAPLLNEMSQAQRLQATLSTEQAKAAEALNKEFSALAKNTTDLARELSGPLVRALNGVFEAIRRSSQNGKGLLSNAIDIEAAERIVRANAGVYSNEGRNYPKPSLPATLDDGKPPPGATKPATARSRPDFNLAEWQADVLRTMDRAFIDANERAGEADARALDSRREQQAQWLDELVTGNARATAALIADERQRSEALIAIDTQVQLRKLESLEVYGDAYTAMREQILLGEQLALQQLDTQLGKTRTEAKDAADDIGLVFASAAGRAITEWTSFRDLLKAIGQDLLQMAVKSAITDPLSKGIGGLFGGGGSDGGFGLGSLLGSLFGGARAVGGPVAAGRAYLVGERGPELFVPRGGGGSIVPGAVSIVQNISVGAGVNRNEVAAAMAAAKDAAVAAVYDAARRGRVAAA